MGVRLRRSNSPANGTQSRGRCGLREPNIAFRVPSRRRRGVFARSDRWMDGWLGGWVDGWALCLRAGRVTTHYVNNDRVSCARSLLPGPPLAPISDPTSIFESKGCSARSSGNRSGFSEETKAGNDGSDDEA